MRNIITTILFVALLTPAAPLSAQTAPLPRMRDVFAQMPDSLLPAVTKNNRLDCIDFIENGLEAKVRNAFDDYVALEALTADYARFRTSAVAVLELKLLPLTDTTQVLCAVTTVECGEAGSPTRIEDSSLRFFGADWTSLGSDYSDYSDYSDSSESSPTAAITRAVADLDFFTDDAVPDSLRFDYDQAKASARDFHPVRMSLSPDDASLTLELQTGQMAVEEKRALEGRLRPLRLLWDGRRFVRK